MDPVEVEGATSNSDDEFKPEAADVAFDAEEEDLAEMDGDDLNYGNEIDELDSDPNKPLQKKGKGVKPTNEE